MSDLDRLRFEYTRRASNGMAGNSSAREVDQFIHQQRWQSLFTGLEGEQLLPFGDKKHLEIGCGAGGVLREWVQLGANPDKLFGIDLLDFRLRQASSGMTRVNVNLADAQRLPFASDQFDIVFQFTAFSSVLDHVIRQQMAYDMSRVLKNDGVIIWYDFWLNPANRQTRGVRLRQIRKLFPNSGFSVKRITLAPPIARRLAPLSTLAAAGLERLRVLNTHYLAIIRPN